MCIQIAHTIWHCGSESIVTRTYNGYIYLRFKGNLKLSKANTTLCRVFNISENNEAKTVEISRKTLASEMSLLCAELVLISNITKEYLYVVVEFLSSLRGRKKGRARKKGEKK